MKKYHYGLGADSREATKEVSIQVRDIIGSTLGPAGRNYFLPTGITNDGRTIMSFIRSDYEIQDQVSLAYHEIARQQDKDGGDNTSTAMFLGANIYLDNVEKVQDINIPSNMSVMELLKALESEKDTVIGLLEEKVVKTETLEDLKKVAMTAMEDKVGADLIAEAVWKGGKDTFPRIDNGHHGIIETAVTEGLEMPLKLENDAIFNENGYGEYQGAIVVVANHVFEKYIEIQPFMKTMLDRARQLNTKTPQPIVIVGKQFSIPFVESVSAVMKGSNIPIILLSAKYHNDTFEDIASFVDAKLIDTHPKKGTKITELKIEDAGFVKIIESRADQTKFIGGRGTELMSIKDGEMITRVSQRVDQIRELMVDESSQDERDQMERRVGALLGGITTVYVDAKTATDRYYLKKKAEDAMNSCVQALNEGMVVGGGLAYKELSEALEDDSMLSSALLSPYDRIIQNNGGKEFDLTDVWDSFTGMKSAIENAVSTVKVLLTIEGIIAPVEKSLVEELRKVNE